MISFGSRRSFESPGEAVENSQSMTRTRAAALMGASLLALAVPASSASSTQYELLKQLQVAQTWSSIRGQYGKVWPLLHPRYQRVTTRAFW